MENNTSDNNQSTLTPTSLEVFWEDHKQDALAYSVSRIDPEGLGEIPPSVVILYVGDEPLSEAFVKERFGGGKYIARVNKMDSGWDTEWKFTIPGDQKPVEGFEEPDVPEQEEDALQAAVEQMIPHLVTILRSIVDSRGAAEEECDDEEPIPYDPVVSEPFPKNFEYELMLKKDAEAREKETLQRGTRLGMSIGAALTAAGINAIAGDLLWLFARNMSSLGKTFGKRIKSAIPIVRQARPAYRAASDDGVNLAYGSPFSEPPIPDPDPDDNLPI